MARRSDHSREELKSMILETAGAIVAKKGFAALTARRIAKDIGYTPGTIYNIFRSMDDICLHLNGLTLDSLYEHLSGKEKSKKPSLQAIKVMANTYRAFAQKEKERWLMLFTHSMPEEKTVPDWYQKKIERLFLPLEELLKPYFRPSQNKKRKKAARTLWAAVHGLVFLEETGKIPLPDQEENAPDMTAYLIDTFIAGLK